MFYQGIQKSSRRSICMMLLPDLLLILPAERVVSLTTPLIWALEACAHAKNTINIKSRLSRQAQLGSSHRSMALLMKDLLIPMNVRRREHLLRSATTRRPEEL
jgi:hypothetical protein